MRAMEKSLRRRLASDRGAVNFVTTFLLIAICAVIYGAWAYVPHWMRNREVRAAMREAAYQAWRVRDDGQLVRMIVEKTDRILQVDDYPVIDERNIRVDRDSEFVYIELWYEIPMQWPGTAKERTISFDNAVQADLKSPLAN